MHGTETLQSLLSLSTAASCAHTDAHPNFTLMHMPCLRPGALRCTTLKFRHKACFRVPEHSVAALRRRWRAIRSSFGRPGRAAGSALRVGARIVAVVCN
eukprot:970245-Pleurochrysis_carterae.AAC.1